MTAKGRTAKKSNAPRECNCSYIIMHNSIFLVT